MLRRYVMQNLQGTVRAFLRAVATTLCLSLCGCAGVAAPEKDAVALPGEVISAAEESAGLSEEKTAGQAEQSEEKTAGQAEQSGEKTAGQRDSAAGKSTGYLVPAEPDEELGNLLSYMETRENSYAECFRIDVYEGGYRLLTLPAGKRVLTVPEGSTAPRSLPEDVCVLQLPLRNTYVAATAVMDMLSSMGAVSSVGFSSVKQEGWAVEEAARAMEEGQMLYAGKYSAPDYELLLEGDCPLAIMNTMTTHAPQIPEKLEELGIPVITDYSSYEKNPLGRMEWIRFYGALFGKEAEAEAAFWEECAKVPEAGASGNPDTSQEPETPTVAFFYIRSDGAVVVRREEDYIPAMIRMAGGRYLYPKAEGQESAGKTEAVQMEVFYAAAKEADYLIYNGTTAGSISSLEELYQKSALFKEFQAVREGHVYGISGDLYQNTMALGQVIADIHGMIRGVPEEELVFLQHLE